MVLLLSDPRVSAIEVRDDGEPLVPLASGAAAAGLVVEQRADVRVRHDVAQRLSRAAARLPEGVSLKVVEGHRGASAQSRIVAEYTATLRERFPAASHDELLRLSSRFVAPLGVAPHVAGAAVDVKLVDVDGRELDMGTPLDATPEQSRGACYFAASNISGEARRNRAMLAAVLCSEGMVNYPTEWWHWSYGDRYWAVISGAEHALYGPVTAQVAR